MSTLPALIDELRKCEREWDGSNMFELARMCREAVDTITELRGALQVASVDYRHLQDENARLRSCLSDDAENARMIMAENAKLREQMERLVTLLRVDCDIDASWDGLRRFWSIGLTEDGCLMRDRACKAEAENAKLRELAADMWNEGMCECGSRGKCARCEYGYPDRMRELGVDA